MKNKVYRLKRNILPLFRGLFQSLKYRILKRGISIGKLLRISKDCDLIFHPGSKCTIGNNTSIGAHSIISISNQGSLSIGDNCRIGNFSNLICHNNIVIGDRTILGPSVMIFDHNHIWSIDNGVLHNSYDVGEVVIGVDTWIGAGSIILNNVHIGDKCIIGAGSVVNKDIPDRCVAVGNPCKPIKFF